MALNVVQVINNDGPNPGNKPWPVGMPTSCTLTAGHTLVGVTTCATFGGAHSAWLVQDPLGNAFEEQFNVMGGQGNLNTDQQLVLWAAKILKGGSTVLTQLFKGGDDDWQACNFVDIGEDVRVVGASGWAFQANHGTAALNTGKPITVADADLPATMYCWFTNISELSQTGNYSPQLNSAMQPVATPSNPNGLYWKFPGDNPQNLPNLLLCKMEISTAGDYQGFADAAIDGEYWQAEAIVVTGAVVTPPPPPPGTTVELTSAQVQALAAGTVVDVTLSADAPAGTVLALTPPASSGGGPTPFQVPNGAIPLFVNGKNYMGGDWSFGPSVAQAPTINYNSKGGIDGFDCVSFTSNGQYSGFQPYFANEAQVIDPNHNFLYIAIKGAKAYQKWQMGWMATVPTSVSPNGEQPLGTEIPDITPFALTKPAAGVWTVYRIPLKAGGFNIPNGAVARKFMIQDDTGDPSNYAQFDRYYLAAS